MMKHYALMYTFVDDYLERRGAFREEHLRKAWELADAGIIVLGGAFADPTDRGLLIFLTDSEETVQRFASNDPYVVNGLVSSWEVREWTTVVGHIAATPVR